MAKKYKYKPGKGNWNFENSQDWDMEEDIGMDENGVVSESDDLAGDIEREQISLDNARNVSQLEIEFPPE
jgi:hypothetical protein